MIRDNLIFDFLNDTPDTSSRKICPPNNVCILLTGLSGAGKSTLANALKALLSNKLIPVVVLDGDVLRGGLCKDLSMSINDREENLRRVAEISKILVNNEVNVIVSMIAPMRSSRAYMKELIGEEAFKEVYISTPLAICENRDCKGMYKKARSGIIKEFTGIDSPYEAPDSPFLKIDLSDGDVYEAASRIINDAF